MEIFLGRGRRPRAGQDELASAVYREYYSPLLRFTSRLTGGDREWAQDVVQETLVRAWRNLDQLDLEIESLMPWLATVARRIVISDTRKRTARPIEVEEDLLGEIPIGDSVENLLRTLTVIDAMRSLSRGHREVIVETFLRDRTADEAARLLGIPVGTVKSRIYYAIRALRTALQERGWES